tara:strand:+ start:510 stop:1172 length:663 start_codon:yes stop_codon:yes gene_type:complete
MSIKNYGELIPKKYKTNSFGVNKKLDIQNLFRGIILSPSFGGKTNLVFDIIANSPNIYAHLHIIARNPSQELYNYLKDNLDRDFITIYDPDKPPTVDSIKKMSEPQLVIIDDYSNDKKLQKEVFSHYFTRGRHKFLSTVFLSHSYFATDKMIRLNSEYVMILKANSKRDLQMLLKDFNIPGVDEKKLIDAYNYATKDKGQMLLIDSVKGELRKNFNEKIN